MKYPMSRNGIDNYYAAVKQTIAKQSSERIAQNAIGPLIWYVETGRAPTDFIIRLLATPPEKVAETCYAPCRKNPYGLPLSIDDTVRRIKHTVNYI